MTPELEIHLLNEMRPVLRGKYTLSPAPIILELPSWAVLRPTVDAVILTGTREYLLGPDGALPLSGQAVVHLRAGTLLPVKWLSGEFVAARSLSPGEKLVTAVYRGLNRPNDDAAARRLRLKRATRKP